MTDLASVYCACGAQWHGEWVIKAADTIAVHQALSHRWVSHDYFQRHHECTCPDCTAARRLAWTEKRQAAAARRGR